MTTGQADFTAAVDLGRLAPSVHNTQPWLFHAEDDVLILRRDSARSLPVLDPTFRQQTISCGAALHLVRLGLRLQGFDVVVQPHPVPGDSTILAAVRAVPGAAATAEEVVLEHAARHRHTQREPFDPQPVDAETVTAMRDAAQQEGAWVRFLTEPAEQIALTVLLSHADEAEEADEAYREELSAWTHRPSSEGDGVPPQAAPPVRGRASNVRLRDFSAPADDGQETPRVTEDDPAPPAEHPLVVVLGTAGDGPDDWLVAGQALSTLLLHAAVDGVQASPLGQVLDQPWSRRRLGGELRLVGYPQMVLRLGHARPGPDTPRRPMTDVLR
ncbi:MAG: Acg family FMN-binding oxidoreductase [Actinomycetes bacterium]